ncbi:MAG: STAS domain-containing protein [Magnetococcales bacterium]|nr:STAS domain-containing protein [Magnetococcales bacterium]
MADSSLSVSREGDTLIYRIAGVFDYSLVKLFKTTYQSEGKAGRYVLDLMMTDKIDSSAIGGLMYFHHFAGGKEADITLINASKEIKRLLNIAQLHHAFKIL